MEEEKTICKGVVVQSFDMTLSFERRKCWI